MNIYNGILQEKLISPKYFYIFLSLFISFWLISLITAIKIVSFWGITLTGGFLAFPFAMALNTLIVEIYGYKSARQAIWSGTILCITYLTFIHIINLIPSSTDWKLQKEFQAVLIPQTRIILASLIAFWCSGFINNFLMSKLKNRGKSLAPRILFSSLVTILLDLSFFLFIAFWGTIPLNIFYKIFMFAFIKKVLFELFLLPFIWFGIEFIKQKEGFEIDDNKTNYNPFVLDNIYEFQAYKKINPQKIQLQTIAH